VIGSLRDIILHKLSEQSLSGYSLSKKLYESTGQKPSFGSIYPILEKLSKENLVTVKTEGRSKIYTLTPRGKEQATAVKQNREEMIKQMMAHNKVFCEITGTNPEALNIILERLKQGEHPLGPVAKNVFATRDMILKMSQDGRLQRHQKEINAILTETRKKLERIK
jgi:DNA-binding PadR family transcriptional regulator